MKQLIYFFTFIGFRKTRMENRIRIITNLSNVVLIVFVVRSDIKKCRCYYNKYLLFLFKCLFFK